MTISTRQADAAIRILDAAFGTHYTWQNKRKGYRDIKWDYLRHDKALKASKKLIAAEISHKFMKAEGLMGSEHWQIRIMVPMEFSLGDARKRNRGDKPDKKAPRLNARQQWRHDRARLMSLTKRLKFGAAFHRSALTEALRALRNISPASEL